MAKVINKTSQYIKSFEMAAKKTLEEVGVTGKADLMANCVVDTGTLRRSHHFKVEGIKKVIFGNYANYAPYVEFRTKGGRPWFRKTLEGDTGKFKAIMEKHFKKVGV